MSRTSKTTITRKTAMNIIIKVFESETAATFLENAGIIGAGDAGNVLEVVRRIRAQMDRPSDGRVTRAQMENEPILREVLALLAEKADEGEPDEDEPERGLVNSVMVRDQVAAVLTTQKAVKLLGELVRRGQAERVTVGARVWFRAI